MSPSLSKEGLGFDLSPLTFTELSTTHDFLVALSQVVCGFVGQPRCSTGHNYNAAGCLMDELGDRINHERSALAEEIARRVPSTDDERNTRDYVLVSYAIYPGDPLRVCLAEAARMIGREILS